MVREAQSLFTAEIPDTAHGDFSWKLVDFNITLKSDCGAAVSKVFTVNTKETGEFGSAN